jgi:hypothetical protein
MTPLINATLLLKIPPPPITVKIIQIAIFAHRSVFATAAR